MRCSPGSAPSQGQQPHRAGRARHRRRAPHAPLRDRVADDARTARTADGGEVGLALHGRAEPREARVPGGVGTPPPGGETGADRLPHHRRGAADERSTGRGSSSRRPNASTAVLPGRRCITVLPPATVIELLTDTTRGLGRRSVAQQRTLLANCGARRSRTVPRRGRVRDRDGRGRGGVGAGLLGELVGGTSPALGGWQAYHVGGTEPPT